MSQDDEIRQRFLERYAEDRAPVHRQVELEVIGADLGANGYTTLAEADVLTDLLALEPGERLLDIGSGRGWPGVQIAARSACTVVCLDRPLDGLRDAEANASRLGVESHAVAGDATALPFRAASFDAIVHTDVAC